MHFKIKIKTQPNPFGPNPETSEKKTSLSMNIYQRVERLSMPDMSPHSCYRMGSLCQIKDSFLKKKKTIFLYQQTIPKEVFEGKINNFSIHHIRKKCHFKVYFSKYLIPPPRHPQSTLQIQCILPRKGGKRGIPMIPN